MRTLVLIICCSCHQEPFAGLSAKSKCGSLVKDYREFQNGFNRALQQAQSPSKCGALYADRTGHTPAAGPCLPPHTLRGPGGAVVATQSALRLPQGLGLHPAPLTLSSAAEVRPQKAPSSSWRPGLDVLPVSCRTCPALHLGQDSPTPWGTC